MMWTRGGLGQQISLQNACLPPLSLVVLSCSKMYVSSYPVCSTTLSACRSSLLEVQRSCTCNTMKHALTVWTFDTLSVHQLAEPSTLARTVSLLHHSACPELSPPP